MPKVFGAAPRRCVRGKILSIAKVRGSMRNTKPIVVVTQTALSPTANRFGTNRPGQQHQWVRSTGDPLTSFRSGSIRDTVLSAVLATHTAPSPTATPVGPRPTGMVATTRLVCGSIRETVPSPKLVTQIAPAPTATSAGRFPTSIVATTAFVVGSMRETVPSFWFATQTAAYVRATPAGSLPTGIVATTRFVTGFDSRDRPVRQLRDPDPVFISGEGIRMGHVDAPDQERPAGPELETLEKRLDLGFDRERGCPPLGPLAVAELNGIPWPLRMEAANEPGANDEDGSGMAGHVAILLDELGPDAGRGQGAVQGGLGFDESDSSGRPTLNRGLHLLLEFRRALHILRVDRSRECEDGVAFSLYLLDDNHLSDVCVLNGHCPLSWPLKARQVRCGFRPGRATLRLHSEHPEDALPR